MIRVAVSFFVVAGAFGCEASAPAGHAPALDSIEARVPALDRTEWLAAHFPPRVSAQGPAPEGWSAVESSLDAATCGVCHAREYADWQTSWHALGMGPGTMGQLVDWDGADDKTVAQCNRCHAPLTEQTPRISDDGTTYRENPDYLPALRAQGLNCAGCHVRAWTRYGPPEPASGADRSLHGGFVAREEFESAAFCSPCHDFTKAGKALEGKLLQETGEEWRRTSFAADGATCQDCHMPDERHIWRGIHDPDMVRRALTATATLTAAGGLLSKIEATLAVTNVGAGHRMPTYTTPQITVLIEQVDAAGIAIAGTRREGAVARYVTPNLKTELFDTRLLPGETYTLPYEVRRDGDAVALAARIEVWPDEAYRRLYEVKLKKPDEHVKGESMLREALARSIASRYTVWEQRLDL